LSGKEGHIAVVTWREAVTGTTAIAIILLTKEAKRFAWQQRKAIHEAQASIAYVGCDTSSDNSHLLDCNITSTHKVTTLYMACVPEMLFCSIKTALISRWWLCDD
jgi:hypothetical protein